MTLQEDFKLVTGLEAKLGRALDTLSWYIDSRSTWFDLDVLALIGDRIPIIAVEFWHHRRSDINSGSLDAKFAGEAEHAKEFGKPIWVRLFHSMNTNFFPWGASSNYSGGPSDGEDPAAFVSAWTRIVTAFRNAGADNVQFIFSPNCETINALGPISYWPDWHLVDFIGADGYSPDVAADGMTASGLYRSFTATFVPIYALLTRLHPEAPFVVSETACSVDSGMQRAYIESIAGAVPAFPRLISVNWLNVDTRAMNRREP